MAPSFDYVISSLYCAEDNASIFDDVDEHYYEGSSNIIDDDFNVFANFWQNGDEQNVNFVGVLEIDEFCLDDLFDREKHHFVGVDNLKRLRSGDLDLLGARNEAINWIQKVQSHYNFGPLCFYLSVNYLDRFLSTYELPKGKAWMMQLLAVACLSIAAKIDETDVPFSIDLQVCESKFVFEAKTIQRMELLVMSTLNWRMQSVTPFSFIHYFLCKLSCDQMLPTTLIFQAMQLILCTLKGIDWLEFKPSEIAASVAISVTQETQTVENPDIAFSLLYLQRLQKEKVLKCVEMMQDLQMNTRYQGESGLNSTSIPQSPNGVLDITCMSYKSDDTSTSSSEFYSNSRSHHNNPIPAPKRRKLDNNLTTPQLEHSRFGKNDDSVNPVP